MRAAAFLDRDGVLNAALVRDGIPHPPESAAALHVLPGVPEACTRLRAAGMIVIVVTNQPDVARGSQSREAVDEIHSRLRDAVSLHDIRVCWHDEKDGCSCRKPRPGLLLDAARDFDIDLSASYMVGDRWKDIEAGHAAGCATVYIDKSYAERRPQHAHATVGGLPEAVDWILKTGSTPHHRKEQL